MVREQGRSVGQGADGLRSCLLHFGKATHSAGQHLSLGTQRVVLVRVSLVSTVQKQHSHLAKWWYSGDGNGGTGSGTTEID